MKKRLTICTVLIFGMFTGHVSAYAADQNKNILPMLSILFNSSSNGNIQDCNGDLGGNAFIDNCGICVGGNTGRAECIYDVCEYRDIPLNNEGTRNRYIKLCSDFDESGTLNRHTYVLYEYDTSRADQWWEIYTVLVDNSLDVDHYVLTETLRNNSNSPPTRVFEYIARNRATQSKSQYESQFSGRYEGDHVVAIGYRVKCDPAPSDEFFYNPSGLNCDQRYSFFSNMPQCWSLNEDEAKQFVLSKVTDEELKKTMGCHEWWDHYDEEGNWVECEE